MYEDFLRAVTEFVSTLNAMEKRTEQIETKSGIAIHLGKIPVFMDAEQVGELRDEIGGSWAYFPGTWK